MQSPADLIRFILSKGARGSPRLHPWIGVDGLRLLAILAVAALVSIVGLSIERIGGNVFWLYIFTLSLIGIVFFGTLYVLGRYERRIWPSTELLTSQPLVEAALTDACNSANRFIVVMGARARGADYLQALTRAVSQRNVEYYRIVPGSKIDHAVHSHLEEVLPFEQANIGQDPKSRETTFANENVIIVTFASPGESDTYWATKTANPTLARDYKEFVIKMFLNLSTRRRITQPSQLTRLCAECSLPFSKTGPSAPQGRATQPNAD